MYKKIIVPLDGSELAECVLPHVEAIAGGCGVKEVVLVRAAESFNLPSGETVFNDYQVKEIEARREKTANDYLARIAGQMKLGDVTVSTLVLSSKVSGLASSRDADVLSGTSVKAADMLTDYVKGSDADLVVIASHGRSGISRWVYGSVADRLLRSACIPVLMIRAPGCVAGI
jgi:nucleotide-binding universal stress UspA family protein